MSFTLATERKSDVHEQKITEDKNIGRTLGNTAHTGKTNSNRKTPALILVDKK